MKPEEQEGARQRFLEDIEVMERDAREAGFDIDATAAMPVPPAVPKPPVTMRDLEDTMADKNARPPALLWEPLDAHSYKAQLAGEAPVRVALSGDVFDEHRDSHTLFSYGGPLFERVMAAALESGVETRGPGVCWVEASGGKPAVVVNTLDGMRRPHTLSELRACLRTAGAPVKVPEAGWVKVL